MKNKDRLGQKLFMGRLIYTYGINYRERAWKKKNLKCILKKSKGGEKKRHGMLLKKHDEKDSAGASRKWQLFHCQQRTGGASSALLPGFVQGICSTFPAGFNMDTHGKEKSNTWSLLGGIPVDCRVVGSSERKGVQRSLRNIPLGCHPRVPMGTPGAFGVCGAKTNLICATEN